MRFLITIHNLKGVTLGDIPLDQAPTHIPLVNDQIEFLNEDKDPQIATVISRMFRWVYDTEQLILTVSLPGES